VTAATQAAARRQAPGKRATRRGAAWLLRRAR
jgi:hypothetical protein